MFDDLQSDGLNDGRKRERAVNPERPLSDREVPLAPSTATIADAVHAWLDGEVPESSVRTRSPRSVHSSSVTRAGDFK